MHHTRIGKNETINVEISRGNNSLGMIGGSIGLEVQDRIDSVMKDTWNAEHSISIDKELLSLRQTENGKISITVA